MEIPMDVRYSPIDCLRDPLMRHLTESTMDYEPGSLPWWEQMVEASRMQDILDRFAKVMKVGAIMTTTDGVPVTQPSNFSSFCLHMREFPEGRKKCYDSDATGGARALKAGRTVLYRCPHGLLDMAGPIIVEGRMVGVLLCGQVSLQPQTREQAMKVAKNLWSVPDENVTRLVDLFVDTWTVDRRVIRSAMELLHMVASHVMGLCERQLSELRLVQRNLSLIREQRHKEALERRLKITQVKALRSQLNPHFMFNTLNVISRLAYFENANRTYDLTIQFAEYLRYVLHQQSMGDLVSLGMELDCIKRYLAIYKVRFGDRLESRIDVSQEASSALVPFMLLQPLVENAIDHGLEPMPQGGTVSISARIEGGQLAVEVADDGVGFNPETTTYGIGLDNVVSRLKLQYGEESILTIDSAPGRGSSLKIVIPASDRG